MIVTRHNLSEINFREDGLIPAIAQDFVSGEVLMMAWVNQEAIKETLERNRAVFWSRSRQRLWEKGETSGHTLTVLSLHLDCDRDTLLMIVHPNGPACHTGTATCFADTPLTKSNDFAFLTNLEDVIEQRIASSDARSYTNRLVAEGPKRLAQKVGEEGLETALALTAGDDDEARNEAADLLFHLAVALKARGLSLKEVVDELRRRHETR
jgi:phosphoribosyl-ATP pyrophosphohydrolase/phosphoribosyl-AMP cyclohydrolase